jgi:peroxiredoxin Q/BCP
MAVPKGDAVKTHLACLLLLISVGCTKDGASSTATVASTSTAPATSSAAPTSTAIATSSSTTSSPAAGATTANEVTVGRPPPRLAAKAHDGTSVDLASLQGKHVVVYFYPKDETPGCTKEACAFRDAWKELEKRGVVLVGVSADSDESHRAFAAHHKLPFLLVSDSQGKIAESFGVPFQGGFTARQTFVIGPDGNVKKIYRQVDVTAHAAQILEDTK